MNLASSFCPEKQLKWWLLALTLGLVAFGALIWFQTVAAAPARDIYCWTRPKHPELCQDDPPGGGGGGGETLPPSLAASLECSQPGAGDWCGGALTLRLAASDPQSQPILISFYLDGQIAACNGGVASLNPTCAVPLPEGQGQINYTAASLTGLSASGASLYHRDLTPPSLSTSLSGTRGLGSWYQTASLNASAADALAGLASTEISLDSGAWTAFSGTFPIPDGQHTLQARATDHAGNQTLSQSVTAWVDRTPPNISPNLTGTNGKNGWYISSVAASASASDATSGLSSLEYALDGGAWTAFSMPLSLTDGTHSLSFYAEDAAGQSSQVDLVIPVDTQAPQIGGKLQGTPGQNGWYLSPVTLTASAVDPSPGSGLFSFTYVLDSAAPVPYTAPLTLTDGQHNLTLTAEDAAGLTAATTQTVKVDTQPPSLDLTTSLPEWLQQSVSLAGTAQDPSTGSGQVSSGLAKIEFSVDNGASWQPVSGTSAWNFTWNTQSNADGAQTLRLRSVDLAGWVSEKAFNVQVDNRGPVISAPNAWNIRNQAKISLSDAGSGLSDARIEISDPLGRAPRRKIDLDPGAFPLVFAWDRQMGDGSEAGAGDYTVLITAVDKLGNVSQKTAIISNPWLTSLLPQLPPALVEEPALSAAEGPAPTATPAPTLEPTPTAPLSPAAATTSFGAPESLWRVPEPQPQPAQPPTRTRPLTETFFDQVENLVSPAPLSAATPASSDLGSNILWGAAAAASLAAFAVQVEQKRREDAERAAQANHSGETEADDSDVKAKRKAKAIAKADPGYAQAQALQAAIATQTAKEAEAWKDERYAQISQTAAYLESENKAAYMHAQLAKIKADEADYREAQKRQVAAEAAILAASNERMGTKMAAIEAQEEAERERAQAEQAAALMAEHNLRMENKMAAIEAEADAQLEKAKKPAVASGPPSILDQGINWLIQLGKRHRAIGNMLISAGNLFDNFYTAITAPSQDKGPLFSVPIISDDRITPWGVANNAPYLTKLLAKAYAPKVWDTTMELATKASGLFADPAWQRAGNIVNNSINYLGGAVFQFVDDYGLGLFDKISGINWENGSDAFQAGRQAGRFGSIIASSVETVFGAYMAAAAISAIPPTTGGTAACAVTTGPGALFCGAFGGGALAIESATAAAGTALAAHGGLVMASISGNPVGEPASRPSKDKAFIDATKGKIIEQLKSSQQQEILSKVKFLKKNGLCDACAVENAISMYDDNVKGIVDIDGEHRVLAIIDGDKLMIVDTSTFGTGAKPFDDLPGGLGGSPEPILFEDYVKLWNKAALIPDNGIRVNPRFSVFTSSELEQVLGLLRFMGVIK